MRFLFLYTTFLFLFLSNSTVLSQDLYDEYGNYRGYVDELGGYNDDSLYEPRDLQPYEKCCGINYDEILTPLDSSVPDPYGDLDEYYDYKYR